MECDLCFNRARYVVVMDDGTVAHVCEVLMCWGRVWELMPTTGTKHPIERSFVSVSEFNDVVIEGEVLGEVQPKRD